MLSLTDTLRYIPFAALHDGEKFLIQNYQLSMMTEAAIGARLEQKFSH
jgi:CHAT domain-containing protein